MSARGSGFLWSLYTTVMVSCTVLLLTGTQANGQGNDPHSDANPQETEHTLVYVSDYVSFIGRDDVGRVAFALDTNRGRDGSEWQAEHFVVLHDEREGWKEIAGSGSYDNLNKAFLTIPDSGHFQFRGSPSAGLTIASEPNDLTLRIEPISKQLSRQHDDARYWMGSAPAILKWKGRVLKGRVIYEFLFIPEFNRLSRTYFGLWNEFQGLYLLLEGQGGDQGDFYLHSQQSQMLAPLVGELAGFLVLDAHGDTLRDAELNVVNREFTWGFYRWPSQWGITWKDGQGQGSLELSLSDRKVMANWLIGGFAMGIIQGEMKRNGRTLKVYGWGELLM